MNHDDSVYSNERARSLGKSPRQKCVLSTTLKRVWVRRHIMTMMCPVICYGMIKSHFICGDRHSVAWASFVYEVKLRSEQYGRLGSYSVLVYSTGLWVLLRNDLCGRTSSYLDLSLYGDLETCFRAGGVAEQCLYHDSMPCRYTVGEDSRIAGVYEVLCQWLALCIRWELWRSNLWMYLWAVWDGWEWYIVHVCMDWAMLNTLHIMYNKYCCVWFGFVVQSAIKMSKLTFWIWVV